MQVYAVDDITDANALHTALTTAVELAAAEGHRADTVYLKAPIRLRLVEETLSDGSRVMNIEMVDAIEAVTDVLW